MRGNNYYKMRLLAPKLSGIHWKMTVKFQIWYTWTEDLEGTYLGWWTHSQPLKEARKIFESGDEITHSLA